MLAINYRPYQAQYFQRVSMWMCLNIEHSPKYTWSDRHIHIENRISPRIVVWCIFNTWHTHITPQYIRYIRYIGFDEYVMSYQAIVLHIRIHIHILNILIWPQYCYFYVPHETEAIWGYQLPHEVGWFRPLQCEVAWSRLYKMVNCLVNCLVNWHVQSW